MADATSKAGMATNLDNDTDEEPPGLLSSGEESQTSDDEDFVPNCEEESDVTSEEPIPVAKPKAAPALTSGHKRTASHLDAPMPKVAKRRKNKRNTSHVSKQECLDVQEIKHDLETKGCSCGEDCLKKLCKHGARAVRAIEKLRLQRFQGKKSRDMQNAHQQIFRTPG